MKEISFEDSLKLENKIFIDVRSPGEFANDHIPGSINLPLFDDRERSEIGKIYKMYGRESAIIKGTDFAGVRLTDIVSTIMKYKEKNIIILCARGGMRSGAVASLINSLGINVFKLQRGYRGYRRYVTEKFRDLKLSPVLFVIQGLTGTGKTEIIKSICSSIDLESMAGHRSSIFGGIGLEQNSQKKFESLLLERTARLEDERFIVVEGESRKIGNLHIPPSFYNIMRESPSILITSSMNRRIEIINNEYSQKISSDEVIKIIRSLNAKLGIETVNKMEDLVIKKKFREFIKMLLEKYYDPLYLHKIKKIKYIAEIENRETHKTVQQIIHVIADHLHGNRDKTV